MIEIENPGGARGAGPDEMVFLKDQSLSTSGSQEKFFEAEGRLYSHIIDPRTARPAEGLLAVSAVASTALESEVWSTAIFVNGLDWASRNRGEGRAVYGCPADGRCRWIGRPH
jgi:thiamine biosynthesis lipoprotein